MQKFNYFSYFCYDCGEKMLQEAYTPIEVERQPDGSGILPGRYGGSDMVVTAQEMKLWDEGKNDQGEIWVRCPKGHRMGWREIE